MTFLGSILDQAVFACLVLTCQPFRPLAKHDSAPFDIYNPTKYRRLFYTSPILIGG